jgi:hypothetical protein
MEDLVPRDVRQVQVEQDQVGAVLAGDLRLRWDGVDWSEM